MILRGEWSGSTDIIRLHFLASRDEIKLKDEFQLDMEIYHNKVFPIIVASTTGITSGVDAPIVHVPARVNIVKNFKDPGIVSAFVKLPRVNVPSFFNAIRFDVDCTVICDEKGLQITNY